MTEAKCDLCGSDKLERVYTPRGTKRGLSVYVCPNCGLVQSLPRIDHVEDKTVSTSGDADWGNVRYGKGFRAAEGARMLWQNMGSNEGVSVLDVGAGRGDFAKVFCFDNYWTYPSQHSTNLTITLIEPDAKLEPKDFSPTYRKKVILNKVSWITERFEDVVLPLSTYDVVHCSHTLEHMKSPMATLKRIWDVMKLGGLLFVEVPNIEIALKEDFIEEFFIDKHLYHFCYVTLFRYLYKTSFEVLEANITQENISVVARKIAAPNWGDGTFKEYTSRRVSLQQFTERQAERINRLAEEKRVLIWGAGRIFDLLLKAGLYEDLWITDKYLSDSSAMTRTMTPQEYVEDGYAEEVEVIVIASREYAKEIEKEARELGFTCEIVVWNEVK